MRIVFHHAPMSSATPVACALRELDVPHERVLVDIKAGDQRNPAFLALNPNGKVPTLVVDGTPMFESLAIMQWLGDRFGVERGLWPAAESPARLEALSWSTWAYVTYAATLQRLNFASSPHAPAELHHAALAEHSRRELASLNSILDGRLATRPHILGESYTLADLIVSGVLGYARFCGVTLDEHSHLAAWVERCMARPAIREEWSAS
jgi:GST-like protein